MGTLAGMLQSRYDQTGKRLAVVRAEMRQLEEEQAKWKAALELELQASNANDNGNNGDAKTGDIVAGIIPGIAPGKLLLSADVHIKHKLFRNALFGAGRPLNSSELREMLPQLSERYVYHLIREMKDSGELEEHEDGRVSLKVGNQPNGSAVKAERPRA